MNVIRIVAGTGMLGTGYSIESFRKALSLKPDVIGCDAGSTDPGPYYLGADQPMVSREATKRDLTYMIEGALEYEIPLLIGTAGTAGTNKLVDWTVEIVAEILQEKKMHCRVAKIYSEISTDQLLNYYSQGKLKPLENAPELGEEEIKRLSKAVGQMGVEPYIEALKNDAQIIIAGRSSDTSIYAAVPIMKGLENGAVWHAAKILECGAGCVVNRLHPDSMFATIEEDHFVIEPPNEKMSCSPASVLSHFLYENTDPYFLKEPSGTLDTSKATYTEQGERAVKVAGSEFHRADQYTIRVEAVELVGHRRICIGGIRDPFVLKQLSEFLEEAFRVVKRKVSDSLAIEENDYQLAHRVYGQAGVMGRLEPEREFGHEVGLLFEVIAETPEQSEAIMAIAWHTLLHHPIKEWSGLVSQVAFPFSPPDVSMGEVFRFAVNHVIEVQDPLELFTIDYIEL
ncbi:acyclic terpene utilization AtuA family protein [Halalkalibacter oceani]|uniref:acyclic terpene utilization AtuA family protein n=1 Tax=Halalkalibacter oceani TaxID=1653776 RepID=UPI003396B6A1